MPRDERGQATVETALLLPLALVVVLAVAQVGLTVRDQLVVTHAAREGARMSAVTSDASLVRAAVLDAVNVDAGRLRVDVRRRDRVGGITTVRVTMTELTAAPLVGRAVRGRDVAAEATMLVEAAGRVVDGVVGSAGETEAQREDGAGLVERLVAVAALR